MTLKGALELTLAFTPCFDAAGSAIALKIQMSLDNVLFLARTNILSLQKKIGSVPMTFYENGSIQATDDSGPLDLQSYDDETYRHWTAERHTVGKLRFDLLATPREIDVDTPIGPRVDLRRDQSGLQGAPKNFLPVPIAAATDLCKVSIQWNLEYAPAGTRAIWTFGEGPDRVIRISRLWDLLDSLIAVGPFRGTPKAPLGQQVGFGYYWFGDPPEKLTRLEPIIKDLFGRMSTFFDDVASASNPYRVFLRCSSPAKSFGGTSFARSYVLEYDDSIETYSNDELFLILAHEMVHNWPELADSEDGMTHNDDNQSGAWYNEGIAEFYSRMLPHRFGLLSEQKWLETVNSGFVAYYTSPVVHLTNEEATGTWGSTDRNRLPYHRGFVYHVLVDAKIKAASQGQRSLDSLVGEFNQKKRDGHPHGVKEYLELLTAELGDSARTDWDDMMAGRLVVPPADAFGPEYQLIRKDREMFEMGYVRHGRYLDVKTGSRAEKAGLKQGDEMIGSDVPAQWSVGDHFERMMEIKARRDGQDIDIKYWPRSWNKVPCWEWVIKE